MKLNDGREKMVANGDVETRRTGDVELQANPSCSRRLCRSSSGAVGFDVVPTLRGESASASTSCLASALLSLEHRPSQQPTTRVLS